MKKIISIAMLSSLIFLSACGGRDPEPIKIVRNEDAGRNCAYLVNEIEVIEARIERLIPEKDKTMENVAYGVAGLYTLYIPWLLIDFKNAEAKEYKALVARHNHLVNLAEAKGCEFVAVKYPTEEEVKKEYEKQRLEEKQRDPTINVTR
jgi:hypothetical protein